MVDKQVTAAVLAGGISLRMGQNKALLRLGKKTMIERVIEPLQRIFREVIVVTNTPELYPMLKNVRFQQDYITTSERNSLVGIYTALLKSTTPYVFVIACDMPFVNTSLITYMVEQLKDEDIVIPHINGFYEPLHTIYGKGCIRPIKRLLDNNIYKITDTITVTGNVSVRRINHEEIIKYDKDMKCFLNVNTYDDYLKVKKLLVR